MNSADQCDYLEDLVIERRLILRWVLGKYGWRV
jgi:hypothetical protein